MENKELKLNVTSTLIEKGVDTAKDFLGKLIMPAVEEAGLLVKDKLTMWRFNNQIKMLNKAKTICEKHKINPKNISLKLVAPLLEYSSLEEDEEMQDKWAIMLSNLVDSEQNVTNHVFPYILSQVSKYELEVLEKVYENFAGELSVTKTEYETFLAQVKPKQEQMNKRHNVLDKEIAELMTSKADREAIFKLQVERDDLIRDKEKIDKQLKRYLDKLEALPKIPFDVLQEFEISNLTRLGLIKEDFVQNIEPMPTRDSIYQRRISQGASILDVNYVPWGMKLVITELGEMFIKTCQEKASSKKT